MDAVLAILTVQGCKTNRGANLVHLDGRCEEEQDQVLGLGQELRWGLEQGLELELELVAGEDGTGGLASKAGNFALQLESQLGLELGPW